MPDPVVCRHRLLRIVIKKKRVPSSTSPLEAIATPTSPYIICCLPGPISSPISAFLTTSILRQPVLRQRNHPPTLYEPPPPPPKPVAASRCSKPAFHRILTDVSLHTPDQPATRHSGTNNATPRILHSASRELLRRALSRDDSRRRTSTRSEREGVGPRATFRPNSSARPVQKRRARMVHFDCSRICEAP